MNAIKNLLLVTVLSLVYTSNVVAAETKKVCHDEQKKGKTVQVCKEIKIHKKLEGTDVLEKKK